LYGLDPELIPAGLRDDDTGLIRGEGENAAGFYAQLDGAFSPDGYFSEGPYYLRYAIFPYLVFSQALANAKPELDILSYRDSILHKATYGLLYQADPEGQFIPINDAQKGMSWQAREVVAAVDMAYYYYESDSQLLSVAEQQGRVLLDASGFAVARDLANGFAESFEPASRLFVDGVAGDEGGLAILRASNGEDEQSCLAVKFTAQGMGHGHFDKLSYSFYNSDGEIIQDYGAARWVNIDQKGGGRYLPENQSWAKQSIAHNTVVINENSHYGGDIRIGEQHHSELVYFDTSKPEMQVVSVLDSNAYSGYSLMRTMALVGLPQVGAPLLIDLFRVAGEAPAQFDLPLWYQGQLMETSFSYQVSGGSHPVMGANHGYQHLWEEAQGIAEGDQVQLNWLGDGGFYTLTSLTEAGDELHLLRLGANDPNFNLRRDPAFMIRKSDRSEAIFLSVLEQHGSYSPVDERPRSPYGRISGLRLLHDTPDYTAFVILIGEQEVARLMFCHSSTEKSQTHTLDIDGQENSWQGPFAMHHIENESNEEQ
ncbi:MAG: heparinase II/III family protein, partial [Bacteroidota bacterium]